MHGMVWKKRRGKWVLRVAGRAGADPKPVAIGAYVDELEAAFLAEQRQLMDPDGSVQLAHARSRRADLLKAAQDELAAKVQARARDLGHRWGYRKVISKELGISDNHVSRLLKIKIDT